MTHWHDASACGPTTAHLFFTDATDLPAKRICARCPVVAACRDDAMDAQIVHGIWGGLSPRERRHHRWAGPGRGLGIAPTPVGLTVTIPAT